MVKLLADFVPVADEVGRLQRGEDRECRFFQGFAEHGHYGGRRDPSDTRQGTYAVAPSGHFLASVNSRDPADVARMLSEALAAWKKLPRSKRLLADEPRESDAPVRRQEARFPAGGASLRVTVRDLPRADLPDDWRAEAWNEDWAWLHPEELRALFEPAAEAKPGASWDAPAGLARRIARAQLVDFVRGQTTGFGDEHVERAELRVTRAERQGERVQLELAGRSRTQQSGHWRVAGFDPEQPLQTRGIESEWQGSAVWDVDARELVEFELIVRGSRWGGTQFNARADDLAAAPIGFVFELARLAPDELVAPAQLWYYGW